MVSVGLAALLPAPLKGQRVPADLLEPALFAYGASLAVVVLEVATLNTVCTLHAGHRAPITALKWCTKHHTRDLDDSRHVRLASGDADGRVLVWDVTSATILARLQDVVGAKEMLRDHGMAENSAIASSPRSSEGVASLAWVMPGRDVLAVVMAPALLLLWELKAGSLLWKRELGPGTEVFRHIATDPVDSRMLCLCGSNGALTVLQLSDPAADKVHVKQYRMQTQAPVVIKQGGNGGVLEVAFTPARGLLLLLLPKELLFFDLDLGAPAATVALPSGQPAFSQLLGIYGSGVSQGLGDEGGMHVLYCVHTDGQVSVWTRVPRELRYKLGGMSRLIPAPSKGHSNQVNLAVVKAGLLPSSTARATSARSMPQPVTVASVTSQLRSCLSGANVHGTPAGGNISGSTSAVAGALASHKLQLVGVTSDGRAWQWQLALPAWSTAVSAGLAPSPDLLGMSHGLRGSITTFCMHPQPVLSRSCVDRLHSISSNSSPISSSPTHDLIDLNNEQEATSLTSQGGAAMQQQRYAVTVTGLAAAAAEYVFMATVGSNTGHVELVALRRGLINPLAAEVVSSYALHKDSVRGVRWLGCQPVVVSFTSEKGSAGGWRNNLLLTDARTGLCLAFRDAVGIEGSSLLDIRISPSGTYILLLFNGAPAELWATAAQLEPSQHASSLSPHQTSSATAASAAAAATRADTNHWAFSSSVTQPWRVRLLDLPFSAVEWVATPEHAHQNAVTSWAQEASTVGRGPATKSDHGSSMQLADAESSPLPSELLAFALTDGRSGVLSVRGRKVVDLRARQPPNSPGPRDIVACCALAAVWPLLLLGDAEGRLLVWDVTTGSCSIISTGLGALRHVRLALSSQQSQQTQAEALPPRGSLPVEGLHAAVLSAGGLIAVFKLHTDGQLHPASSNPIGGVGRAIDMQWVPLPRGLDSTMLAAIQEDGSLAIIDLALPALKQSSSSGHKQTQLRQVLCTPVACHVAAGDVPSTIPVVLQTAQRRGSSMLLPRAWSQLLRFMVQAGMPPSMLQGVSGQTSSDEAKTDLLHQLRQLLPLPARGSLSTEVPALLRLMAEQHSGGQLLSADQWHMYAQALDSGLVARRMAVAARIFCQQEEVQFWEALPVTLARVQAMIEAQQTTQVQRAHIQQAAAAVSSQQLGSGEAVPLWDEQMVLADAQERALWSETLSRQLSETEQQLTKRLLQYLTVGDFAAAVAFLLGIPPEQDVKYYRSVICALALAATASLQAQSSDGSINNSGQAAATLHLQAAKVVSAHAASIGDSLLAVALNCSAGLNLEAVNLLQEAGLWQHGAVLTARTLTGTDRAHTLTRWAHHVLRHEGSVWRCVGILTAAGCLGAAAQVLQDDFLPDAAQAYITACQQAGLVTQHTMPPSPASGTFTAASDANSQLQGLSIHLKQGSGMLNNDVMFQRCTQQLELFDLLAQQGRQPVSRSTEAGSDQLSRITATYSDYLAQLLFGL